MNKNLQHSARVAETVSSESQLPAFCYTDATYHQQEMHRIYASGWMSIGFVHDYAIANQAWSLDVLGKPILITRDNDNALHVFHNVCRHRGHVLLASSTHSGKRLNCPYHAWCYALDGRFIKAPFWDGNEHSAPDEQQKSTMGLIPIRFEVWYDMLFINLSDDAGAFEALIAPLHSRWAELRPSAQLRCFSRELFSLQGNWKLAAENFLDNYHLPWIHPELGESLEASIGLDVENQLLSDDIIGFSHPSAGADKGKTETPLPCWPRLSEDQAQRQDLFFLFPNTCLVMEGYYLWSMILLPDAVDRCQEQLALYVIGDDAMQAEFDKSRTQLSDVIYQINRQDQSVIANLQRGRQSDAASAGVYTHFHDQLGKWFHRSVATKMQKLNPDDGAV